MKPVRQQLSEGCSALRPFTADGKCADPQVAKQLAFVAQQVAEFARMRCLYQATHPSLNNGTIAAGEPDPHGERRNEIATN